MKTEQFDEDFDLKIGLTYISEMLDILINNKAYMYIGFDSMMIEHSELIKRTGWTDRKIKASLTRRNIRWNLTGNATSIDFIKYFSKGVHFSIQSGIINSSNTQEDDRNDYIH